MSPKKHATHENTSFLHPWAQTSRLHTNIPRSCIHETKEARYTRIYLVLHPWAQTSTLHTNTHISPSCIHEPKEPRYMRIYLVLASMSPNKHATRTKINAWAERSALQTNHVPRYFKTLSRNKRATHENTCTWAEASAQHSNINVPRTFKHLLKTSTLHRKILVPRLLNETSALHLKTHVPLQMRNFFKVPLMRCIFHAVTSWHSLWQLVNLSQTPCLLQMWHFF